MNILEAFMAYAADFEKSYEDDEWSRLRPYFTDDAVYEVDSDWIGCKVEGPDAILVGMKKSLDGFDRKFTGREISVEGPPKVEDDQLSVTWTVTYSKDGVQPFVLPGCSVATYRDGKIAHLKDTFEPSVTVYAKKWMRDNEMTFDGSYV